MKKVFLFMMLSVLTSSMLVSCSKDDKPDPIVGEWYFYSDGGKEVNDCEKKTTITFLEDYTLTVLAVYSDDKGNCESEKPAKAKWEKLKEGKYLISVKKEGEEQEGGYVLSLRNNNTEFVVQAESEKIVYKKK